MSKPNIGCQHFKSIVKNILGENNTLHSAMGDICDNIYGIANMLMSFTIFMAICSIEIMYEDNNTIYKIKISDNLTHGFKDIHKNGTDNPLNMGHIRIGQQEDLESSEFGTGLKKALIFMARVAEIYTRCVDDEGNVSFVYIKFEFVSMCNVVDPALSYEPTRFECITEEVFRQNHPANFETGSTIILSELRENDYTYDDKKGVHMETSEFEKHFRDEISKKMSGLIRQQIIQINVNTIIVEAQPDIVNALIQDFPDNTMHYEYYADVSIKSKINDVLRVGTTPTGKKQIKYLDESNKFKKCEQSRFEEICQKSSVLKVEMISFTTFQTQHSAVQFKDTTFISRNGRCFGDIKITNQETDGYSNHIAHDITYTNKKLNPLLGVGSNKLLSKRSNRLMTAIHLTQKECVKKYRKYKKTGSFVSDNDSDSDETMSIASISIIPPQKKEKKQKIPAVLDIIGDKETQTQLLPLQLPLQLPLPTLTIVQEQAPLLDTFEEKYVLPQLSDISDNIQDQIQKQDQKQDEEIKDYMEPLDIISESKITYENLDILRNLLSEKVSNELLESVTNIIIQILDKCNVKQISIVLKYVPFDMTRIRLLIDIIATNFPTKESREQCCKDFNIVNLLGCSK